MLNPIFLKKIQGQKHPGGERLLNANCQIIKMLFKINTNDHEHPSISLFIIEQVTVGETKENNKWHSTQEPHTPE